MANHQETIIREAYAAFGRGDVDAYLSACTENFSLHIPGHSTIAGTYLRKEGMYNLAGKAFATTAGTFQEEVEDVLANDHHACVLALHRFTREGHAKEYGTAHIYRVEEGKLAECWEQPRDPAAFDDAWG